MNKLIYGLKEIGAITYLPCDGVEHTSVISFNMPDYEASEVGTILSAEYNIAVRTGFHCAPFIHDLIKTRDVHGTVRASLGYFNTENDINCLIEALRSL